MLKILRPSTWGLRLIDLLFILFLVAVVVRFIAPTSGFSIALQQLFHGLAIAVQWIANALVMILNWI